MPRIYGGGGELAGAGHLLDGEAPPIIVESIEDPDGAYYDLIDGYHRLGALLESKVEKITVIVVEAEDLVLCQEFGGDEDSMDEEEWIEYLQREVTEQSNPNQRFDPML